MTNPSLLYRVRRQTGLQFEGACLSTFINCMGLQFEGASASIAPRRDQAQAAGDDDQPSKKRRVQKEHGDPVKYHLTEHEGMDPSETENASLRRAARLVGQRSRLSLGNFGTCYWVSGKLRVTAVCIACAGCKSRKGLSCLFEGGWLTGPAGGLLYHCTDNQPL